MQVLDASSIAERGYALPQLISHRIEEPIPESLVYDRKAAGGKFAFLRRVLWYAWRGIIHGIEAWKRRSWLYGLMLPWTASSQ